MKEHEIQHSISEGVARVLRSEVAHAQGLLRRGQRKGVKFEVVVKAAGHVDASSKVVDAPRADSRNGERVDGAEGMKEANGEVVGAKPEPAKKWAPGHCAECYEPFVEWEVETLVGFACGHVFHLTHLLERLHPGEEVDEVLLNGLAEQRSAAAHLIGPKVTHARLLRDRITGGCPVCVGKQDARYG